MANPRGLLPKARREDLADNLRRRLERWYRDAYEDGRPDWTLVASLVEQAYRQVAPSRRAPRVSRPEPRVPTRRSR